MPPDFGAVFRQMGQGGLQGARKRPRRSHAGGARPDIDRFRGQAVRYSLPWLGSGEWWARNPLRLHFGEIPDAGDTLPAFPARLTEGGTCVLDTALHEPAAEAALLLLLASPEERPCWLLRGTDRGHRGVLHVEVEEAEILTAPVRPGVGTAEHFFGEFFDEARELLTTAAAVLTEGELEQLEAAMYDTRGMLPRAFQDVADARDRALRKNGPTTDERRARSPLYLRFGDAPEGGRSRDWKGGLEEGVSCFRARRDPDEDSAYVIDASADSGPLTMFKTLTVEEGREAHLVAGEEIGLGGAREPLLTNVDMTPLPPGTRIRITEEWQEVVTLAYAVEVLRGFVYPPHIWRPSEEYIVPDHAAPQEPAGELQEVLDAVLGALRPGRGSELHGEAHWRRVAVAGARLAKETPGADRTVVLLFALLHDAGRLRDALDEHHAYRGARLARELLQGSPLLTAEQLSTLLYAIERHAYGETSADPTIGACWDADRLNLWRVGIRPAPRLLSTAAARSPELIEWGRELQTQTFAWEDVFARGSGPAH